MDLLSNENSEPCIPSAYCTVGQKHWPKQPNPEPCSGQALPNITPMLCSQLDYGVLQCKLTLHCCKTHLTLTLLPKCESTGESITQHLPTHSNVIPTPSHLYSAMVKYPTQPTSNKAVLNIYTQYHSSDYSPCYSSSSNIQFYCQMSMLQVPSTPTHTFRYPPRYIYIYIKRSI